MSKIAVMKFNDEQFIEDFKYIHKILVYANGTYLQVRKCEVWEEAQNRKIKYYLSDKIFKSYQIVMVLN